MSLGSGIRDPGSGIRNKPIPDPGSRIQRSKMPQSRIPDPDPQHWEILNNVRLTFKKTDPKTFNFTDTFKPNAVFTGFIHGQKASHVLQISFKVKKLFTFY
jgi:hypothetical protein